MQLQILILFMGTLIGCGSGISPVEIHIAFITSFDGEYDSSVTVPAVQLATRLVNSDQNLLPGHELVVELIDNITIARSFANSQCNKYDAQRTFLEQIISGRNKVALIGCGCSLATEPVAEISRFWNITHISYTPSSDYLSNRQLFPSLWKTYPSESSINSPIISILKQYNWTKLKIITQEESLFMTSFNALKSNLTGPEFNMTVVDDGITTFSTQTNVFNLTEAELFPDEVRVYFLNMYPVHARRIMCRAAYNQKMNPNPEHHYPGYVWITLGWYQENWWRASAEDNSSPCTDEDLEPFLRNTFSIQLGNRTMDSNAPTDVKLTTAEFERNITEMPDYSSSSFSVAAYLAYDAIWTLAKGIDRILPTIQADLANFNYSTNGHNVTEKITAKLSDSEFKFIGVSGEVRFDKNGTRAPAPAKIFKYRDSNDSSGTVKRELIATDNGSALNYVEGENTTTTWPGGRIPSDGTPIVVLNTYYMPIYIIYDIAVVIGIGFALVCLLFNFIFRNRKIVRLISPNLNYFIILGAILLYISVAFFVFPTLDPFLVTFACNFRAWTQTLGYFLCFGTIVAKMWRVYFIFNHPQVQVTKARQRAIKDWHLMLIVITLCAIVVIFFTGVAIFADYKATEVQDVERPDTRNEDNVLHDSHNLVCQGPSDLYWIIAVYAYILITQLISVFLAFKTRKVKIKALNDAKYITVIIYATSIIVIVMIVCAVVLSDHLNADGAVFGGLFYIFATIVLSVLFIPKMVILYKDPKGEKIFERTHSVSQMTVNATNNNFDDIEKYCRELEGRLGKYEKVVPYNRSNSQSSIRKFSASTGFLASLPPSSGPTPSSPIYNVNPTLSLPATPVKMNDEGKMTDGTSGYLSDSPPSDKGKQLLSLDLGNEDNNRVKVDVERGIAQLEVTSS